MATLFQEISIADMTLRNRLVRSATWEGMCAPDGRPPARLAEYYRDLAAGGVGLIISGYTFVRTEGKQSPGKMGIQTEDFAGDYRRMTRAVHEAGGKIAIQLVHAGGQTDTETAGRQPLAPSAIKVDQFPEIPAELSTREIAEIVAAFGAGARRAKAWGCDAVQLHGAHGYLINQFLSPLTNHRTDEYGGGIEARCRFLLEVYSSVREAVGAGFPVLIKLNATDNLAGGLETGDAFHAARMLTEQGISAIEVSAGTAASGAKGPARIKITKPRREAYLLELARGIKGAVDCPVISVGGFRSYEIAEQALQDGSADVIAMARPLIREPDLPNRWQQGNRAPAKCISCNGCFKPGVTEGGIYCVMEKREREKAECG